MLGTRRTGTSPENGERAGGKKEQKRRETGGLPRNIKKKGS